MTRRTGAAAIGLTIAAVAALASCRSTDRDRPAAGAPATGSPEGAAATAATVPDSAAAVRAPLLSLPDSDRFLFASGATLTVVPVHELPLVTVHVFSEGGARLDPEGRPGLASFTAGLLEEGPEGTTREQFLAALDRLGAQFHAKASLDDVGLSLDFRAKDLDAGLELLLAAALRPGFDDAAVARAKERTLGQLIASREDEAGLARETFLARLFPDHRYGIPLAGTPQSVRSFTREDALAFARAAFSPANLRVLVVGDVDAPAAGLAVASAASKQGLDLGVAMAATSPPFAPRGRSGAPRLRRELLLVNKPGVVQPQVIFGCLGPDPTQPDATALRAANVPFGSGFTSWLIDRLRVDLGLTYSASSVFEWHVEGSVFYVSTFSKNATIGQLLTEAFALLDKLRRGELDEAALARGRLAITRRTVQQMETTAGVAGLVKQEQLLRLGADSVARSSRELAALTVEAVKAAVARQIPDSQHVLCVVVGDADAIGDQLRKLGEVEVVDYRTLAPASAGDAAPAEHRAGGFE